MEFNFDERHRTNLKQKERIGAAAADLVKDGQTLILDTGTTTLELARALAKRNIRVSIYTTSLVIASELWGKEHITLYLLGGQVRSGSPDLAGPLAEIVLERVTVDFAFLGSDGIDPQRGSFAADLETARISERMAVCAKRLVVIADSSKLGRPGAVRYAGFDQIDRLITDKAAPKQHLKTLRKRGIEVTCV
jgi:DeoR/GlpR family transcriptional regulator of sugar metabolism